MAAEDQDFVLLGASDVQDFNKEGLLPLPAKQLEKIQTWLSPTEYAAVSSEYGKHRTSHLAGTGTWMLDTKEYQQWYQSDQGALWIKAVAGAGKSVIAASLISRLTTQENVPVLYFFFRHIVSANQKPKSLICDYMSQVLQYCPVLQKQLYDLIQNRRTLQSVSVDDMWKMLVSALEQLPRVYCFVDALDEMDQGNDFFLHLLVNLAQQRSSDIKLLMTSRPVPRVESILRNARVIQIALPPQVVDPDISVYVQHRLHNCNGSDQFRSRVHHTVSAKSNGHFLYARLMMDDLLDPSKNLMASEQNVVAALEKLPQPMAGMYTQMLLNHAQRSGVAQELQLLLLQWVTRVERPIRLLELSTMVETNQEAMITSVRTKNVVREACGPLLEILDDETVCPIHHSFTEYLYDQGRRSVSLSEPSFPILDYHEAQRALSLTCLKYLCSGWHHDWHDEALNTKCSNAGVVDDERKRKEMKLNHPFLEYAAGHWDKHTVKSGFTDSSLVSALDDLLVKDSKLLSALIEITAPLRDSLLGRNEQVPNDWTPLHIAAEKGLGFYITQLVANGQDIDSLDRKYQTPLLLAARNGHVDAVLAILQAYPKSFDEPDDLGLKPLHYAARNNHYKVVKLLLESGVEPLTPKTKEYPGLRCGNAPRSYGDTPVKYACISGHVETIQELLPWLANKSLQQAFYDSMYSGHSKVAIAVLRCPRIDINGNDSQPDHPRPLSLACTYRDVKSMRLLLDMGANLIASTIGVALSWNNCGDGSPSDGYTLLHAFARAEKDHVRPRAGHTESDDRCLKEGIEMLLDAGIEPNALDASGFTALHYIVRQRNYWAPNETREGVQEGIELLLSRGADPKILAKDGSNVLHLANNLPLPAIESLIDHGVDINHVRKSDGKTPLITALNSHDWILAKHLLNRGAGANVGDHKGNTPLHTLAKSSDFKIALEMLQALVSAGADVNARNRNGDTIMHMGNFKLRLLKFAIKNGFDLETKNKLGHSVLFHHILQRGAGDPFEALIDAGSDVFTRDAHGSTVLHGVLARGINSTKPKTADLMHFFVKHGVDPCMADNLGNTLWHAIAKQGSSRAWNDQCTILDLLRDWQVPALAQNHGGRSPLHIAFSVNGDSGPENLIKYLIEKMGADVNVADINMIRPIHLASSWSLAFTCKLLELNADPTLKTLDGQTPLMIACRNRQCNTVCMLLDHFKTQKQLSIVDEVDIAGRTALHYACRSGRPETVRMLLNAGADANIKDEQGHTPMRLCADYVAEQSLWNKINTDRQSFNLVNHQTNAVNIVLEDMSRSAPRQEIPNSARVRESIRLLIKHGADTSSFTSVLEPGYQGYHHNPLTAAMEQNCPALVSELFAVIDESKMPNSSAHDIKQYWQKKLKNYKINTKTFLPALKDMEEIVAANLGGTDDNVRFFQQLLEDDNESAMKHASKLGVRFLDLDQGGDNPLFQMVKWGFTDLIREIGDDVSKMTVAWTKEMALLNVNWRTDRLKSILHVALTRQIPNLEMVKILVSEYKIDINEYFEWDSYTSTSLSYVHLIARPSHWWHTEALEFLLEAGADIEARTSNGDTPLMIALQGHGNTSIGNAALKSVEILLQHGANPNVVDKRGQTCLNISIKEPRFIKLLLEHGADPAFGSRPFLFDVIKMHDLETLKSIIETNIDVNILAQPVNAGHSGTTWMHSIRTDNIVPKSWQDVRSVDQLMQRAYPLHVAAFVDSKEERAKATDVIQILLKAGADPLKAYKDGTRLIHVLAEYGHVVKPLVEHSDFDIETRDNRGRTVFLAACDASPGKDLVGIAELPVFLLEHGASPVATDFSDRNALHCLIAAYDWYQPLKIPSVLQSVAPTLVSQPDCHGRTPFHFAVQSLHFELIESFLSFDVDPQNADPLDGTIVLHHLAGDMANNDDMILHNRSEVIHTLKEQASVNRFPFTFTLHKPLERLQEDDILLGPEEAERAHLRSPRRLFSLLLKHNLSIETPDHTGETPLFKLMDTSFFKYTIAGKEEFILFKVFEDLGANFKARNKIGQSLLHKLATRVIPKDRYGGRTDEHAEESLGKAFQWLIKKGVDVSWEDECGRTCLDVAAAMGAQWVLDMYKRK